eukprot:2191791-Amphidinium_carterae.1
MGYHPVALTNTGAELNTVASLTTTLQVKREGESPNQYSNVRMSFGPCRVCSGGERTMNVSAKPAGIGQNYDPIATATVMSSALVKTLRSLFGGADLPAARSNTGPQRRSNQSNAEHGWLLRFYKSQLSHPWSMAWTNALGM